MALEPQRTVEELRELQARTGDENGAQRLAWTDTWEKAREFLRGAVAETGAAEEIDEAGDQWFTLRGASDRALLIGGEIGYAPHGRRGVGRPHRRDRRAHGLRPERRLARRLPQRHGRRRGAAADRRRGDAAADRPARLLGRRGGCALRALAVRVVGCSRLDGRPGRAPAAPGQ